MQRAIVPYRACTQIRANQCRQVREELGGKHAEIAAIARELLAGGVTRGREQLGELSDDCKMIEHRRQAASSKIRMPS